MNLRPTAGTCLLLALLIAIPATGLPDIDILSPSAPVRTGTVRVTMTDINGTATEENVAIAYAMGGISEIPASAVFMDEGTGIVTVTLSDSSPARHFTLLSDNNAGDGIYITRSVVVAAESNPLLINDLSFAAVPATANYYLDTVPEGKQHEWVDLDWNNPEKDLGLTVYAPDATFGPYSDTADGRKDGRIFLDVGSRLNVTPGAWFFKVRNNENEYTPYTLNTYSA